MGLKSISREVLGGALVFNGTRVPVRSLFDYLVAAFLMKIILDECLPKRLTHLFPNEEARTVPQIGLAGSKDGKLLEPRILS